MSHHTMMTCIPCGNWSWERGGSSSCGSCIQLKQLRAGTNSSSVFAEQPYRKNMQVTCSSFSEWLTVSILQHTSAHPTHSLNATFQEFLQQSNTSVLKRRRLLMQRKTVKRQKHLLNGACAAKLRLNTKKRWTNEENHHLRLFVTQTLSACRLTATLGHAEAKGALPVRLCKNAEPVSARRDTLSRASFLFPVARFYNCVSLFFCCLARASKRRRSVLTWTSRAKTARAMCGQHLCARAGARARHWYMTDRW